MRVAVQHTDPEHPDAGVAAYRFGLIEDFTHPITGERTTADDIAVALLDQARAEFPESSGYTVRLERLEDDGTEPCYLCLANGQVSRLKLEDDPDLVPEDGGSEREVPSSEVAHLTCPNCKGERHTAKGAWKEIDEQALRARASGEPVDVPLVEHLDVPQVQIAAEQHAEAAAAPAGSSATEAEEV